MGNCCDRCFGRFGRRKYLRTRYNVERDFSIEFENLMDDENQQEDIMNVVTPRERLLLSQRQYGTLIEEQQEDDKEKDKQLVQQEEELRREEEAYYEAKRAAAHAAKIQRQWEQQAQASSAEGKGGSNPLALKNGTKTGDEEDWDVGGTEDDFETFLENVKARSLAARTRALPSQVPIDQQSTSSLTSKDRTDDCASSLDLEWEHEAGMQPPPKHEKKKSKRLHQHTREEIAVLAELAVKPMLHMKDSNTTTPNHPHHQMPDSSTTTKLPGGNSPQELDWDSDTGELESSEIDSESRTLLSTSTDNVER